MTSPPANIRLTRTLLLIMAFSAGLSVANIYYNQPLLGQIRQSLGADYQAIGMIPSLSQAGYAIGMLFLIPLGDMFEKKRLVLFFSLLSALCALTIALAPNVAIVAAGSLALGLSTMTPQLLVPFAAQLAQPEERGKVIGTMVSGILMGILLARTISGFIGALYGWRVLFGVAAGLLLLLSGVLAFLLPRNQPSYRGGYPGLLKSVADIFRTQPVLREACLFGGMLFGAFSAFWATLIYLMESPAFRLDSRAVGLCGLVGVAGALLSPAFGMLADRNDARQATGVMLLVTLASFLIFMGSAHSLLGLGIGVLVMDIGVQAGHVANQSRIFKLIPNAQSRIQTAYMFCYFVGGALGSIAGSWSWSHYQWPGVCVTAILMLLLALGRYLLPSNALKAVPSSMP